jgi:hypothetical protein
MIWLRRQPRAAKSAREKLRGTCSLFVAAIPVNRDILLCFRNEDATVEATLREQLKPTTAACRTVTDRLLLVTPDGMRRETGQGDKVRG